MFKREHLHNYLQKFLRASEMVESKMHGANPEGPSSIPRIHSDGKEEPITKSSLTSTCASTHSTHNTQDET
jgi:hypothetical protein